MTQNTRDKDLQRRATTTVQTYLHLGDGDPVLELGALAGATLLVLALSIGPREAAAVFAQVIKTITPEGVEDGERTKAGGDSG